MPDITLIWHQPDRRPTFEDADFYEPGTIVVVTVGDRSIAVDRDGDSRIEDIDDKVVIQTPEQFRFCFSDGALPGDGTDGINWINNAWFDLYDGITGEHIEDVGDIGEGEHVAHNLSEAIADAEELLNGL